MLQESSKRIEAYTQYNVYSDRLQYFNNSQMSKPFRGFRSDYKIKKIQAKDREKRQKLIFDTFKDQQSPQPQPFKEQDMQFVDTIKKNEKGETSFHLGSNKKRLSVSNYMGKVMINLREFFDKDGEWIPTKKGITLSKEQWELIKKLIPKIDAEVAKCDK